MFPSEAWKALYDRVWDMLRDAGGANAIERDFYLTALRNAIVRIDRELAQYDKDMDKRAR